MSWHYAKGTQRVGPLDDATIKALITSKEITANTLVWRKGMEEWRPASQSTLAVMLPAASGVNHSENIESATAHQTRMETKPQGKGTFGNIGGKISEVSDLPEINDVPVREILFGGLARRLRADEIEETLAVGTKNTTPSLETIVEHWPQPSVFWRVLAGAVAVYILMRIGVTEFRNPNFIPGMILIGSFVVPFSIVVFFFETNLTRNVSIYQVCKLLLLGGALGLIATMILGSFISGSGTGDLRAALLTGVLEETGKALALLLIVAAPRYSWQTNGLLFGAAVGAGFAGFESAGYAFMALFHPQQDVFDSIMLRGLLAPGGHVIWTAMIGSAIWKAKGDKPFELSMLFHPVVIRRWAIAVVLHGLWDSNVLNINAILQCVILSLVGWYITFAILKQALLEIDVARKALLSADQSNAAG